RELFDVGFAGPAAGFVALIPFLLVGIARSKIGVVPPGGGLLLPGRCLAIDWATALFHRPLRAGEALDLHPFALAAWLALLATAPTLLPLGQLDGGHVLYAAVGRRQRLLSIPVFVALVLAGRAWPGWWLWCGILLVMGIDHPPVVDEREPLNGARRALTVAALALLAASFIPVPLRAL